MPYWFSRLLVIGDHGPDVEAVQQILGLPRTGEYDQRTAETVRGAQQFFGLPATGEVDDALAHLLGPRSNDHILPDWYKGEPLSPDDEGYSLVADQVGGEQGIRRIQGNHGIKPTGVIDEQTALILGARGVRHG